TDSAASEETASAPPNAKPETKPEAIPSPSLDFSALAQASPAPEATTPEATAAKPTATSAAESAAKPIAAAAEPASRMQPVTKIEPPPIPDNEEEKTRSLDFSKLLEEQTTPKSEATKSETAKSKAKS